MSSEVRKEVVSVGRHSIVYVVGTGLAQAVGFFMIPVYTRFISPGEYGVLELINIVASVAALVIYLGVSEACSRFYYAEKTESSRNLVVSTVVIGFAAVGVPISLALVASSSILSNLLFDGPGETLNLQVTFAATWFGLLCQIGYSYLRMRYMAVRFIVLTTIQLIIALSLNVVFIVRMNMGVLGIQASTLISQAVIGVVLTGLILRKTGVRVSLPLLMKMLRFGAPLVPATVGSFLGFVSNRLFLKWLGSPDPAQSLVQLGILSLGHKFGVVVNRFVNSPFNSFWSPRRLELLARQRPQDREIIGRMCTYSTLGTIFASLLICAGIEDLIKITTDERFHSAYRVVPFIAATYVLIGMEPHFTSGLVHTGRTRSLSAIGMISLAISMVWCYLLIPHYGLSAAVTSNFVAAASRQLMIYVWAQRVYYIPFEVRRLMAASAVAVGVYLGVQWIHTDSVYISFVCRVGVAACFPLVLYGVGFYRVEEVRAVRQLVQSRLARLPFLTTPSSEQEF